MQTLEIALLSILLLFPIVDLVLEKYKFREKSAEYIKTAVMLWLVAGFLAYCFFTGALSIAPPQFLPSAHWKGYLAIFIFATFVAYIKFVVSSIKRDDKVRLQIRKTFEEGGESLAGMLPESRKEVLLFTLLVSVSAGVCEELVFRWYLYSFIEQQASWIAAVFISSFVFGLWHLYLGWKYVIRTAFVGAVLCIVYLYFESILVAMIAHILMDVYSGTIAYVARNGQNIEQTSA